MEDTDNKEAEAVVTPGAKAGSNVIVRGRRFIQDVLAELRKCHWPTRNELIETTVLVLVAAAVLTVFVLVSDQAWQFLFKTVLRIA